MDTKLTWMIDGITYLIWNCGSAKSDFKIVNRFIFPKSELAKMAERHCNKFSRKKRDNISFKHPEQTVCNPTKPHKDCTT